jgi:hypothetical protein
MLWLSATPPRNFADFRKTARPHPFPTEPVVIESYDFWRTR